MEVIPTCAGMARAMELERTAGKITGLVPTMGALHAGHVKLVERMTAECEIGAVSIFVNPTQFGPNEDLDKYPRALEGDLEKCEAAGVRYVFTPTVGEMYPDGFCTTVRVAGLPDRWCGASRPGHFDGVATVVAKLFAICRPQKAFFGQKDYQQLQVVTRMAADLNLGVEVVGCPTVREADGLAMSSRNAYLKPEQRAVAPKIFAAMRRMDELFSAGETAAEQLAAAGETVLSEARPAFSVEYLAVVDPATLEPRTTAQSGDRILVAAKLGSTRLIDNMALTGTAVAQDPGTGDRLLGSKT
jgi:pantoate--beta-alanine ligase